MQKLKLNILEINMSRAWGGLEMQMPIMSKGLKDLGHSVFVVCPEGSETAKKAGKNGLETIYLENRINYIDLFTVLRLKKIIQEKKIDVVHSHLAKDLWLIIPAARMAGCGRIFFTRHMESHYRKRDFLHCYLHRSLTGAVAITDTVKESLIYTTHIPEDKIKVIYYGLDLGKFNSKSLPGDILRKEYNLTGNCILIGVVGRLEEGKGQEYLIRAVPHILKRFPKVKIFIIGEETVGGKSGYKKHLESVVKELKIENDVIFTGFRSDIPSVMNSLDIFVLPSKREAFGLVIIEAMAMGKIVIATDSSGTREIIDNGINGFLIPSQNTGMLAEKIIEVLSSPEKMKEIGIMARKKVEEKFEFNKNIKELENFLLSEF